MLDTHSLGYGIFRSSEPGGFGMLNRSGVAEKVEALPSVDDEALATAGWFADATGGWSPFINLHDCEPADPPTEMRVLFSDEGIFVGARCSEPGRIRAVVPPDHPTGEVEIEGTSIKYTSRKDDHFAIFIDPTHRADDYFCFSVTTAGYAKAGVMNWSYAEAVHPICNKTDRIDVEWARRAVVAGDAWYAFISVPWKSLGLDGLPGPASVGFDAIRYRSRPQDTHTAWARVVNPNAPVATDFGDCYLGSARVFMPVADFGRPVFDRNTLRVTLEAPGGEVHVKVRGHVLATSAGRATSDETVEAKVPADDSVQVDVPYLLDWQEPKPHRMTLEVADAASGVVLMRTEYRLARSAEIGVTNRFDFPEPLENPSPDEEDFVTKKRNWLNWRTGQFGRKTTAQGAPSDFCLERADGKVLFNLMEKGICRRIAGYIECLFDNDLDRMCGASLMMHQKAFVMHCGPLCPMHTNMTPESAMRLNGGHCYARALGLAGVMREIHYAGTDRRYDATIMFVLGHVVVVLRELDGRRYVFDPSFGAFYYYHDNTRLATEHELAADPSLHERYIRNRRKDFCSPETHSDGRTGCVVWPTGAPIDQG